MHRCHGPQDPENHHHILCLYGQNRTAADSVAINHRLCDQIQTFLAGLGAVPWIVGGDWNLDPQERRAYFQRAQDLQIKGMAGASEALDLARAARLKAYAEEVVYNSAWEKSLGRRSRV